MRGRKISTPGDAWTQVNGLAGCSVLEGQVGGVMETGQVQGHEQVGDLRDGQWVVSSHLCKMLQAFMHVLSPPVK